MVKISCKLLIIPNLHPAGLEPATPLMQEALDWLRASGRFLVFEGEDGRVVPTSLGLAAARSTLPLGFAAGFGQLTRDVLSLEVEKKVFGEWSSLEHAHR